MNDDYSKNVKERHKRNLYLIPLALAIIVILYLLDKFVF